MALVLATAVTLDWLRPQGVQLAALPVSHQDHKERLGAGSWQPPFLPYTLGTGSVTLRGDSSGVSEPPNKWNVHAAEQGALHGRGGGSLPPTNKRKLGHQLLLPSQPFLLRPKIAQPDGSPRGGRASIDLGKPPTHCQFPYSSLALPGPTAPMGCPLPQVSGCILAWLHCSVPGYHTHSIGHTGMLQKEAE